MAEKDKKTEAVKKVEEKPTPVKYTKGELRRNCYSLFGVANYVFDDAVKDVDFTNGRSIDEIKKIINKNNGGN